MTDNVDDVCRDCGKVLRGSLFGKGETRVLGAAYCEDCVQARTLFCHTCRNPIQKADFDEGRAVTLLGRRFCEGCLEAAVKHGREKAVADPSRASRVSGSPTTLVRTLDDSYTDDETIAIRRAYGRYVPPSDADLEVKGTGLGAILGNRTRLWLDVSEGGFRAIISGAFKVQDRLSGRVTYRPGKESFDFKATIMHARPSRRYPGCVLVGVRFDQPSRELQGFIRSKMSGRPVMIPSPSSRPATQVPPPKPASA